MDFLRLCRVVVAAGVMTVAAGTCHALTFDFYFDEDFTQGLPEAPFVGTGPLSFLGDPGNGDILMSTLSDLMIDFTVAGESFTEADITTDLSDVFLRIEQSGGNRTAVFFGDGSTSSFSGALDFESGSSLLSTGPFEANVGLYLLSVEDTTAGAGSYAGYARDTSVTPLPASLPLVLGALAGLGLVARRRGRSRT